MEHTIVTVITSCLGIIVAIIGYLYSRIIKKQEEIINIRFEEVDKKIDRLFDITDKLRNGKE